MKWKDFEDKANKFLVLNKEIVASLENKKLSAKANVSYWLKIGKLISLKRGVYLLKERYQAELEKDLFLEYLSNLLLKPSYLSLEYVMAKYQLLSEPVNAFTSVTTLTTRTIKNKLAFFRYYSITSKLFTGYNVKYFSGASIFEATKEKAIFDFIYFRFFKNSSLNEKIIEELRINWSEVSKVEWQKVREYEKLCRSKKVKQALMLIEKMYF